MTRSFFVPVSDVLVSHLEGEAVLLHMGSKHYYQLNRTGAHIWKGLESGADSDTIARSLAETFDVTEAEAAEAVRTLCADLVANELIRDASAGT